MRVFLIVLDGVGIGAADDTSPSNTLVHLAEQVGGLKVRTLQALGLGKLVPLPGLAAPVDPTGARGRLRPQAPGADCRTGFFELAGVVLEEQAAETGVRGREESSGGREESSGDHFRRPELARGAASEPTLLERLSERGVPVRAVGRVTELFEGRGIRDAIATANDEESEEVLMDLARRRGEGLVFAEALDPARSGRAGDRAAFARALERFDGRLEELLSRVGDDDLCMVTADHGNDPPDGGTDPTRECVPLLMGGRRVRRNADVGNRRSLADVGATLADLFGARALDHGTSFLREIRG
jgi:phosphopentomutase